MNNTEIRASTGRLLSKIDKCVCDFLILNENSYSCKFLILKGLKYDIIIGADFLNKHGVVIDYDSREIRLEKNCIKFKNVVKKSRENEGWQELIINGLYEGMNNSICDECVDEGGGLGNKEELNDLGESEYKCIEGYKKFISSLFKNNKRLVDDSACIAPDIFQHKLVVNESLPFNPKIYPIPEAFREQVNREIQKMLDNGIIERKVTSYINPIVVVKKKTGDIRLCLDARLLNTRLEKQYELPGRIDAILSSCYGSTVFSKLDLKHSFWLIKLHEDSRKYTGFTIAGTTYQFRVVPFGISTATSALTYALERMLNQFSKFCVYYVDDILIFSKSQEEHCAHLEQIIHVLSKNGMKLSLNKCEFFQNSVSYLGYIVNQFGITLEKDRLDEIKSFPKPCNVKKLQSFLGLLNYYKRFIPNISEICIPLFDLLKKNTKFKWLESHEEAFTRIRSQFYNNLLLLHPNFQRDFYIRTDGSDSAIAGVLFQYDEDHLEYPIFFVSRKLTNTEQHYTVGEIEMLAIVFAITKFKYYILGRKFFIQSDNKALSSILNTRILNNRIYRYYLLIQNYDFEIQHISGKQNLVADIFSRLYSDKKYKKFFCINNNEQNSIKEMFTTKNIINCQKCNELGKVFNELKTNNSFKGFTIRDNMLVKRVDYLYLIVLPKFKAKEILCELHNFYCHLGLKRLHMLFRERFVAKTDWKIAKKIVNTCWTCQLYKTKNYTSFHPGKPIISNHPRDIIAVDFLEHLLPSNGFKNILIILDCFSKLVRFYPTHSCNGATVIKCLQEYFNTIGLPKTIIFDNGKCFQNSKLLTFISRQNVRSVFIAIRNPKSNPSERSIRELLQYLRIMCNDQHLLWPKFVPVIEEILNSCPTTTNAVAPIAYHINNTADIPRPWNKLGVVAFNIPDKDTLIVRTKQKLDKLHRRAVENLKRKNRKITVFKPGDFVIVRNNRLSNFKNNIEKKFLRVFEGPFVIKRVIGNKTYEICYPHSYNSRGIFSTDLLYKFNV